MLTKPMSLHKPNFALLFCARLNDTNLGKLPINLDLYSDVGQVSVHFCILQVRSDHSQFSGELVFKEVRGHFNKETGGAL